MQTFTMKLTPRTAALIERLAREFDANKTAVVCYGLYLASAFAKAQREGKALGVVCGDQFVREYSPPWGELEPGDEPPALKPVAKAG